MRGSDELLNKYCELLDEHRYNEALSLVTRENAATDLGYAFVVRFCTHGPDDEQMLNQIVALGAMITKKGYNAPIHFAAVNGKHKLVRALIGLGCDVNEMNISQETPLTLASNNNHLGCIECILNAGGVGYTCYINFCTGDGGKDIFIPKNAEQFLRRRERCRSSVIAFLALWKCRSETIGSNGKDALRIIGRCVWSERGNTNWNTKIIE